MKRLFLFAVALFVASTAHAQDPATGFPPFGSFANGGFDTINRQNLNVNFGIPVIATRGRGLNLQFSIVYDSLIWMKSGNAWVSVTNQAGTPIWGWKTDAVVGSPRFSKITITCRTSGEQTTKYLGYAYIDTAATRHSFSLSFYDSATACGYPTGPRTGYATDGSGFFMDATEPELPVAFDSSGNRYSSDANKILTDTNGNFISKVVVSSTRTEWKDTLGRTGLTIEKLTGATNCGTGITDCIKYTYKDNDNVDRVIQMNLQATNVQTHFACSGVTEYNGAGTLPSVLLPVSIVTCPPFLVQS